MKPFVEELCATMDRRMKSLRDELLRETARAEAAEADCERDRERNKHAEQRLQVLSFLALLVQKYKC
jgi:hypothetical protein